MIKSALANWKTTSAGILMIGGSIIHLVFQVKSSHADETAWTLALSATVGGIGLIAAGDANKSQPDSTKPNPNP